MKNISARMWLNIITPYTFIFSIKVGEIFEQIFGGFHKKFLKLYFNFIYFVETTEKLLGE